MSKSIEIRNLYKEYNYINYIKAKNNDYKISEETKKLLEQITKRFNTLKNILYEKQITPIFITQVEFNGLEDNKLYFVNELIKQLAEENNYYIIKLDELVMMEAGDFYDKVHTTPQGSDRIAETIYPYLKKILKKLDS